MLDTIKLDNVEYVRKDSITNEAEKVDGMKYVMIRTYSAGVHFGYLKRKDKMEVELLRSKRVYSWSGACSLSQLAIEGSKNPNDCKISIEIPSIILTEAIEIRPMSQDASDNLNSIKVWKK